MTNTVTPVLVLDRSASEPLSRQIAWQIKAQIRQNRYAPGQKISSVRELAQRHSVSTQTVVEAYSNLVATGFVVSRRGSGYFVAQGVGLVPQEAPFRMRELIDPRWMGREVLTDSAAVVRLGGGGMAAEWVDHAEISLALRRYAHGPLSRFGNYGTTYGYEPLRRQVATMLAVKRINVDSANILLTSGATQALDLIIRRLTRPGETALIDDPGYFQTTWALKTNGVRVVGVPRTPSGPDPEAFERLCVETQARTFFTQSALQNPTGSTLSLSTAYEVLRIAERHGVQLVEDDVSGDLAPDTAPRLAMLDRLDRVIYVGSFSKTLSPSLRVGYLATSQQQMLEDFVRLKLTSTFVSCEPNEAIVHSLLDNGHYARQVRRLQRRLQVRAEAVIPRLNSLGFTTDAAQPYEGGTFVWARHLEHDDAMVLTEKAAAVGILLAPGCAFRPNHEDSAYFRFALPLCTDTALEALAQHLHLPQFHGQV